MRNLKKRRGSPKRALELGLSFVVLMACVLSLASACSPGPPRAVPEDSLKQALAQAPINLIKAQQALSKKQYKEAIQFATKIPHEAKESKEAQNIRALAAKSLGLKTDPPRAPAGTKTDPIPAPTKGSPAAREEAALLLWRQYKHEGLDMYAGTEGSNKEVLELRADMFKFGPERRTAFAALNRDKKTLCDLGFEAIKVKEDRAFGNEDTWSLSCRGK